MRLSQEDESQTESDEIHTFDQADDREKPRQHATLCLRLAGDPAEEGVAGDGVTDASSDGGAPKGDAEPEYRSRKHDSVVSHCLSLLVMFLFQTLTGHTEVHDRQQHEDERLDEPDEENVEALPDT